MTYHQLPLPEPEINVEELMIASSKTRNLDRGRACQQKAGRKQAKALMGWRKRPEPIHKIRLSAAYPLLYLVTVQFQLMC